MYFWLARRLLGATMYWFVTVRKVVESMPKDSTNLA
jgi:hypothetical protein